MNGRWGWFRDTYLSVDPRSMGLFRVSFGCVLFSDLVRRWVEAGSWYTNSGLLPNHTLLWRPPATHMFSLFFTISNRQEAAFGFALCALAYAAFTVGFRTGSAQVLTLLARVSLNSRLSVLENGGDMGQSQFFVMYSERIPNSGYAACRQAFSEWLEAYPQRTGHPADCLLTYDVYLVTDASPAPGTKGAATPVERQRFMSYSAPVDGPCRPLPPTSARPATSVAASR